MESMTIFDKILHVQESADLVCMHAVTATTFMHAYMHKNLYPSYLPTVMPLGDKNYTHVRANLPFKIKISHVQLPYFSVWIATRVSKMNISVTIANT